MIKGGHTVAEGPFFDTIKARCFLSHWLNLNYFKILSVVESKQKYLILSIVILPLQGVFETRETKRVHFYKDSRFLKFYKIGIYKVGHKDNSITVKLDWLVVFLVFQRLSQLCQTSVCNALPDVVPDLPDFYSLKNLENICAEVML